MAYIFFDRGQLNRIELKIQELVDGLKLKEQLDRIEANLASVSTGGMTEEEMAANAARMREIADKLKGVSNPE